MYHQIVPIDNPYIIQIYTCNQQLSIILNSSMIHSIYIYMYMYNMYIHIIHIYNQFIPIDHPRVFHPFWDDPYPLYGPSASNSCRSFICPYHIDDNIYICMYVYIYIHIYIYIYTPSKIMIHPHPK